MKNRSYTWRVTGVACMTFGVVTTFVAGLSSGLAMAYIAVALFGAYQYSMASDWQLFESKEISLRQTSQRSLFKGLMFFVVWLILQYVRDLVISGVWSDSIYTILGAAAMVVTAYLFYRYNLVNQESQIGKQIRPESLKTAYLNEDKRRYTLVIEEAENHGRQTLVKGIVHGEVHLDDEVVVLHPNLEGVQTKVIQIDDAGTHMKKDAPVTLLLDTGEAVQYGVVASYLPSQLPDGPQENPLLAGLAYEYGRFRGESGFAAVFFTTLIHSKFLVPVMMDHSPRNVNGKMAFVQDTKVGFMSVNRTSGGQTQKTYALFTDANALRKWKDLFKNGAHPKTLAVTFQDAVTIMWKGHQGLVINPFGPIYVYLSAELIDTITKQEVYRKEFGAPGEHHLSFDRNRKDSL